MLNTALLTVKLCSICNITKHKSKFSKVQFKNGGKQKCKECINLSKKKALGKWIECTSYPFSLKSDGISDLIRINRTQFIAIGYNRNNYSIYAQRRFFYLQIYETITNKWSIPFPYLYKDQSNTIKTKFPDWEQRGRDVKCIAFDVNNSNMYAIMRETDQTILTKFSCKHLEHITSNSKNIKNLKINKQFEVNDNILSAVVDGELHLIISQDSGNNVKYIPKSRHFILNLKLNKYKFIEVHKFKKNHSKQALIYIKSKNILLLISLSSSKKVCCYNLKEKKWIIWNVKNLQKTFNKMYVNSFSHILTENERFIVIFGGKISSRVNDYSDKIQIFDIERKMFILSRIKCPYKSKYKAVLMNSEISNELLISGYFRRCWGDNRANINQSILPQEIKRIIWKMFRVQKYVHLISDKMEKYCYDSERKHYKIPLSLIFSTR